MNAEEQVTHYGEGVLLARTYAIAGEIGELWRDLAKEMGREDLLPQMRKIGDEINVLRRQIVNNHDPEATQDIPVLEVSE